jgi:choice-of-anchor A domain-containing protein
MSVRSLFAFGGATVLAFGLSLPLTTAAQAESLTAIDIVNTYNLVVFGDLNSNSEIEGKTFVQGDIVGNGSSRYNIKDIPNNAAPGLTVGGSIKANVTVNGKGLVVGGDITGPVTVNENGNGNGDVRVGGNVTSSATANFNGNGNFYIKGSVGTAGHNGSVIANGGSIYAGGTVHSGSSATANGGGSLNTSSSVPTNPQPDIQAQATAMHQTLSSYSSYLNSLAPDSSISVVGGTATFNAMAGSNGVAVFDITDPSQVFSAGQFQFSLGDGVTSIIINVSGALDNLINISANFLGGLATTLAKNTIWNFTDATNIDIQKQFGGTILALLANVQTEGNIEGSLIAKSVTQNAEIHAHDDITGVAQTPVPASLPLFVAAIGGLVGWQHLRRRKQDGGQLAA